jgi:hypothetical protein
MLFLDVHRCPVHYGTNYHVFGTSSHFQGIKKTVLTVAVNHGLGTSGFWDIYPDICCTVSGSFGSAFL